jgi:hypothetical protein
MTFEMCTSSDDAYWKALNLREGLVGQYEAMARSALQRIYEVIGFKTFKEKASGKMGAAALAQAFAANAKLAKSSEPVSESLT